NKIYLSASFLNTASSATIINVILEEIGHYVDAQINQVDSAGDEGAIFSELVQGNSLDVATLDALRAENDQTIIIVNGEIIQVEQANFTGTNGNDNITGTSGDDNIDALGGNDTINGNGGLDNINGGAGIDLLIADYSLSNVSTGIVNQSDRIRSTGGDNLLFFSNIEKFNITGSQNNDSLTVFNADHTLNGGVGNDTLSLSLANVTTSVSVNFSNTQNQVTYGNVSVKNFEYVGTLTLGTG
ncbi:MAG: calcium-binding protein, partial [Microcystis panniformis]